jgi:hypothetical protein
MDASLMGAGLPKFGKKFPCARGARDPIEKRAERMKGRRARDVVSSMVKGAFVGGVNRRVGFLALNGFPKKKPASVAKNHLPRPEACRFLTLHLFGL